MKIRILGRALPLQIGLTALLLAGCHSAPQPEPVRENASPDAIGMADETQQVAEAALGKQAEILAHGDLARNGREQLLTVNPFTKAPRSGNGPENSPAIFITRAVILENSNGHWTEILRCDEYLKNPNGYLGGSSAARVTGWRLEFSTDTKEGLELKFTPADGAEGKEGASMVESANQTFVVRWNAQVKRYQLLDAAHARYLNEAPALETPQSILR
jgi:hypothetical protein